MNERAEIIFRPGPAGRRPGLAGGPDVWEVVAVEEAEKAEDIWRSR